MLSAPSCPGHESSLFPRSPCCTSGPFNEEKRNHFPAGPLSLWNLHVLPMSVWVFLTIYSGFLPISRERERERKREKERDHTHNFYYNILCLIYKLNVIIEMYVWGKYSLCGHASHNDISVSVRLHIGQ